jgi:hypothetical protein
MPEQRGTDRGTGRGANRTDIETGGGTEYGKNIFWEAKGDRAAEQ